MSTVFKGETQPMSEKIVKGFIALCIIDAAPQNDKKLEVESKLLSDLPFVSKIVLNRIEEMKLPITFTPVALSAIACFAWNPGTAVVLLIDALTRHENEVVDLDKLTELYPDGFYTEKTFVDYIDNYIKPRKVKWSEIY